MRFILPPGEVGAEFRHNGLRSHDIDPVDAGQVYTADALQLGL